MHISIYKKKKDVAAIIHAHPVYSSAFTAMKRKIYTHLTAEACAILGTPAFVPYALMGTKELAEIVSESALGSDILLLENHGILATGTSLLQAFDKIEVLENAAKMTMIVELSNDISPLSEARITEIEKNFRC
jgi:L-fuculose-phosphate aldolase